ncbi:hypothetical protein [Helicobacter canis]|uniref:Uncharacterized protein n=1 Tax=Helicobacter canis NCTC 12740 TaxID=1357399 RepID=V8CEJ0_9HELI|nr:hypothetical protein [Helicobacter canis]ETD25779.1 hypothetical protein HMPREF2087_01610 [Helicobacter canis NCTC 12740]
MGFSNSYVERLRKKARGVILPTQEICAIIESSFDLSAPRTIADFGAGTLYFSEYFAEKMTDNDISIGGGQQLERVSFLAKNGDYCGESAVTYDQVCALDSPCKAPFLAQKSFREEAESNAQSKPFSSTILESKSVNKKQAQDQKSNCEPLTQASAQSLDSSSSSSRAAAKDSRICENTPTLTTPQAAGFCDDFVGCQGVGAGSYLSGNDYPPNVCNQSHCSPKAESPKGKVVAIDSIYTTLTPTTHHPNITLESSLDSALAHYAFDLFFASDVLHHLSQDFTESLLESIAHIPIIIIKDIDSRHIFGHYANALHDLVFNQEKVCKVYPNKLESTLQALGYTTRYHYLPKLWYPHFLLLAYKAAK